MNCCNEYGDCRQGRDCPARSYKAHFDELGQMRETTPPLHAADLAVIALAVLCIAGMWAGLFA